MVRKGRGEITASPFSYHLHHGTEAHRKGRRGKKMSEKRCYNVSEIQHILGISKSTAYNLIKENQFRSMLIGGKYVISKKSFDEWLDGEINMSTQEQAQSDQKPEEKQERQEGQMEPSWTDAQKEAQATVEAILEKYGYYRR